MELDQNSSELDQENTIDWSTVDVDSIPADVISKLSSKQLKGNEFYGQALSDAIERRQELKALRENQVTPSDDVEVKDSGESETVTALRQQVEQLTQMVETTVNSMAQTQTQAFVASLKTKYNLSDEHAEFLTAPSLPEMEAQAKKLASLRGKDFKDDTSGVGDSTNGSDTLKQRIQDRLLGKTDGQSSFDLGLQTKAGGRAIT